MINEYGQPIPAFRRGDRVRTRYYPNHLATVGSVQDLAFGRLVRGDFQYRLNYDDGDLGDVRERELELIG